MVEETFPQFFSTFDMDKSAGKSTISKITKFESDLLKTNEDIVVERHTILEMFVWCSGAKDTNLLHPPPHHTNVCKFLQFCGAISLHT